LQVLEEKAADLQEENLKLLTKNQSEQLGLKQSHEHEISEYKKRMSEIEESCGTYKS
jgi:hypothetical protein